MVDRASYILDTIWCWGSGLLVNIQPPALGAGWGVLIVAFIISVV